MTTFPKDTQVRVRATLTTDGVLASATVAATLKAPGGATTNPTVTNPATGVYEFVFTANASGQWVWRMVASGAAVSAAEGRIAVAPSLI